MKGGREVKQRRVCVRVRVCVCVCVRCRGVERCREVQRGAERCKREKKGNQREMIFFCAHFEKNIKLVRTD